MKFRRRSGLASSGGALPTLDLTFLGEVADSRITYSGGANGTRVNSAGLIVAATTPRFDYDPTTLLYLRLLDEEARTNLAVQSSDLSQAAWSATTVTKTANQATSPDGNLTAARLAATAADSFVGQGGLAVAAAQVYTVSIYMKADAATTLSLFAIDGGGGSGNTSVVCNVTTSWQRFSVTRTASALTTTGSLQIGGGSSFSTGETVYAWGGQFEIGPVTTSIIPTTVAAVTRSADSAKMTGTNFSSWYNQLGGTVVVEFDAIAPGAVGFKRVWEIDDNTNNNTVVVMDNNGVNSQYFGFSNTGGVAQCAGIFGQQNTAANTAKKIAFAFTLNDFSLADSGILGAQDTAGTLPTVTQLVLGNQGGAGGAELNGHLRRIRYWPVRLSDATLQRLST